MGLAVLGLQQSRVWGWGNPVTWICIAAGVALLVAFVLYELRIENPLIQVRSSPTGPSRRTTRSSSC
jgi:hypothetical protein